MRFGFIFTLLLLAGPAFAAPKKATKVIVQVDVAAHALRVEKVTKNRRQRLDARALPMVKESMRAGVFRPTRLFQRFRSINGNIYLENVIFFDGSHTIRTSRIYNRIAQAGTPVTGSVTLEPDFGSLLFDTIAQYGKENTVIVIRK
jgi:hypothetical protein